MGSVILTVLLGVVFLASAAEFIVRGAAGLSQRFGFSKFAVGLVLISAATALPELSISLQAIRGGLDSLALGTVVGNTIANFGLTMGLAAMFATLIVQWRALNGLLVGLIVASLALIGFGWNGELSRLEGWLLILLYVVVMGWALVSSRSDRADVERQLDQMAGKPNPAWLDGVFVLVGLIMLYFGSLWIAQRAPALGEWMGLSPLLVGLLPIAIVVTLPEAVMAIAAARRGEGDLVIGHVIGSSLLNTTVIIGLLALNSGTHLAIPHGLLTFELPMAAIGACLMYPMLRGDMQINRPEGAILSLTFVVWLLVELWMIFG